ncbi:portal protein [Nitrincola sp. A-D6]|uniref:portal protein n=1 Tax=Nitrincola sp. A-D6 TaxID=1545442 RepID=UPI0009DDA1FA|nr:portal protein [Nitrincola sp. A-D6]
MQQSSASGRYEKLSTTRKPYLNRARTCASVTIPALFPPENITGGNDLPTPYQSIGSRGVNSLGSKLLLSILPPNEPFFRMTVSDFDLQELGQNEARGEVEDALASIERAVMEEIESKAYRVPTFEVLKQLLVAGNVLAYVTKDKLRVFRLDRYVVERDPAGNLKELIVKETVSPFTLDDELLKELGLDLDKEEDQKDLDVFTVVKRTRTNYSIHQEVKGFVIEDSKGSYPLDKLPWLPLRLITIDGEDYGRSYVEEYIGDLISMKV